MKNRILCAALAALLLACGSVSVHAGAKIDGRASTEAYIADITVDGKIDDAWNYANEVTISLVKKKNADWYKDTMKTGVDYAGVTIRTLWDGKDTLFLLWNVKDKTPNKPGSTSWKQDSVEFFTNMKNEKDGSANITQWRMVYDTQKYNLPGTPPEGCTAASSKTADGWIAELAVNVKDVGGAGQYLGLEFQYNDNVVGKENREVCLGWTDDNDSAGKNNAKHGQCLLSATKVADLKAAAEKAAAEKAAADKAAAEKAAAAKTTAAPKTADASVVIASAAAVSALAVLVIRKKNER